MQDMIEPHVLLSGKFIRGICLFCWNLSMQKGNIGFGMTMAMVVWFECMQYVCVWSLVITVLQWIEKICFHWHYSNSNNIGQWTVNTNISIPISNICLNTKCMNSEAPKHTPNSQLPQMSVSHFLLFFLVPQTKHILSHGKDFLSIIHNQRK